MNQAVANGARRSGLSAREVGLLHAANVLVGGTGLLYAAFLYLLTSPDPYAVVNHPWQPAVQHLHVVLAPLLVFAAALAWRAHARDFLARRVRTRWRSGLAQLLTLAPMVASGYLLQVSVEQGWRAAWAAVHISASLLWLAAALLHLLGPRNGNG